MLRPAFLALGFFLVPPSALGQTTPTESQTLQALLTEVRQLRHDLQTSAIAARKAQIVIYRLHVQEAAVARASELLDETKAGLQQWRTQRSYQAVQIKRYEEMKDRTEDAAQRKQFDDEIADLRTQMEASVPEEQELQSKELELEQQLRIEQAKLDQLEGELDRLDQAVMNAALQMASPPQ
jgi:chromosome segregation ATPase